MEEKVAAIEQAVADLCERYDCEIGVWLTWEHLMNNIHHMKINPQVDLMAFPLQIKFKADGTNDTEQAGDTSGTDHSGGEF